MSNLSIISQPPAISLIDDGLNFKLNNSKLYQEDIAYLTLDLQGTYADYSAGKTFTIQAGNNQLVFSFKDIPQENGLELITANSNETISDIKTRIIELFKSNYILLKDYEITLNQNGMIQLTARKTGMAYNITLTATDISVLTVDEEFHGVDSLLANDYAIYMATCLTSEGEEAVPLGEDLLKMDENQEVSNNIAAYIKNQIKTAFTFPFTGTNIITVPDAVKKYFIRYAEYQDGDFQKLFNTFATALYAVAGGLKQIDQNVLKDFGSNYFSFGYNAKRFLTWASQTKETFPGVTEKIYFLIQTTGLKLMKKAIYADSETVSKIADITAPAMSIIEILCGNYEIFTEAERDGLLEYEIWIENSSNEPVSEIRTFTINTAYFQNIRTLIFKNSFGMYDTIHCTGIQSVFDNVKRTIINVFKDDIFHKKVSTAENNSSFSLNTGYLPGKESRLWLEDLQLSKDVFLVIGDILLPVIMNTSKLLRTEDNNNLYSLQLDFEPDYNDSRYSALTGEGVNFVKDADYKIFTDENGVPYIY